MWFNFRATSSVLFSFVRWRIVMVRGGGGGVGGGGGALDPCQQNLVAHGSGLRCLDGSQQATCIYICTA